MTLGLLSPKMVRRLSLCRSKSKTTPEMMLFSLPIRITGERRFQRYGIGDYLISYTSDFLQSHLTGNVCHTAHLRI